MLTLGIETSCDETAAAVLEDGDALLSNVVYSQIAVHVKYGGVVPELASRKHIETIHTVVGAALEKASVSLADIGCIAVTRGPGLIGCLLVGLSFAKALSYVRKIPCIGVDHIAGHLLAILLEKEKPEFPYIALVASGGHTSIFLAESPTAFQLLGRTRDDAAGEAFDKVAKILGLEYPGGPAISRLAGAGNRDAITFPRAWLEPESFEFSFSGIKTAVANHVAEWTTPIPAETVADICASFQEAVIEILAEKTLNAAATYGIDKIVLAGGVGANPRLREYLESRCRENNLKLFMPSADFCTDNAAMIAMAGFHNFTSDFCETLDMDAYSRSPLLHNPK